MIKPIYLDYNATTPHDNEVGTVQPIAKIARVARQQGIVFHTDGAQSSTKIFSAAS
jgi:cysteine sulfinate desulfinase/cysteine desulfurase-like protein